MVSNAFWDPAEAILGGGGEVTFGAIGSGGLRLDASNADYSAAGELNLFSVNDVNFDLGVQNAGAGDINVVAGWDGVGFAPTVGPDSGASTPAGHGQLDLGFSPPVSFTYDFTEILNAGVANAAKFGQNNGEVLIGSNAAVAVGSRAGNTNVLGYGVTLTGGTANSDRAVIGYYGLGNATGAIDVRAKVGGVSLAAGTGSRALAKIGHGQSAGTDSENSGDIRGGDYGPGVL